MEKRKVFMLDNGMFPTIDEIMNWAEIPPGLIEWCQTCNVDDVFNFGIRVIRIQ